MELVARAKRGLAFLEGPVAEWQSGLVLQKEAKLKKAPAHRELELRESRSKLSACVRNAKSFDEDKATTGIAFSMPTGKSQTPSQLTVACQEGLKSVEAEWKKALAALEAEKAKQRALEAKEKARAAKDAKDKQAKEAKVAKEKAAKPVKQINEKKKK